MLPELKRCNSIGDRDGILFLVSIIADANSISRQEIQNRCALENGIRVHCPGAIGFFDFLGLISIEAGLIVPNDSFKELSNHKGETILRNLAIKSIDKIVGEGILDGDKCEFDTIDGRLVIKKSAFPLSYAAIRNYLINVDALTVDRDDEYIIPSDYESSWIKPLGKRRALVSLEQLMQQKEEQNKRGLAAEEYVLKLEKERLPQKAESIKRISDYDVSAGYDLVSFSSAEANQYDRFIEVKCYIGQKHFYWSENEVDAARILADKYVLCLVDYTRLDDQMYVPDYIYDPYNAILKGDEWLINTSSYRITKI